jgi:hypothetical protein
MRPAKTSGRNRRWTNHFWYQTAFRARVATSATMPLKLGSPNVPNPIWLDPGYGFSGLSGAPGPPRAGGLIKIRQALR